MRLRSEPISLWLDGRCGMRSAILGTVIAGGIGALLDAAGTPGYAVALAVIVLVLPVDLLIYRLSATPSPASAERQQAHHREEEPNSKDLTFYAASGSR